MSTRTPVDAAGTGYRWRDDPFRSWRVLTYVTLGVAAGVAWWVTGTRTQGMDMSMGPGAVVFFMGTWVVMMAAMMFPSVAPMVATYVALQRGRRARSMPYARAGSAVFVSGYLVAWSAAGLLCYGVLRAGQGLAGDAGFWQGDGRWVAAAVIGLAAAYELTPAKYACLSRCRSPVGFVVGHWRDGHVGALRMGVVHGLWCVGCCWGLMAALVALGLMNLGWMAAVALLIAGEKLLPRVRWATGTVTVLLAAAALVVAFAPDRLPGAMS